MDSKRMIVTGINCRSLYLLSGNKPLKVRSEDCLGQVGEPFFEGKNICFIVTQKQSDTIRLVVKARESREAVAKIIALPLYVSAS